MFLGTFLILKNKYSRKNIEPIGGLFIMLKIRECKKLMKKCKVCGELKLISDFIKRSDSSDGYRNKCSCCRKKRI